MSSVFLIGAGASFGSGPCSPENPPLGTNFFEELQKMGGVASTVSSELAELFASDFEAGMDAFFAERNTDVTEFLRDMAEYFCKFEPLDGNLYCELIKILCGDRKKATFVTTNYDLLIELAAVRQGMLITYGGLPVPKNNLPILKIHGSCNFLPDISSLTLKGVTFDISQSEGGSILEAGVKVACSAQEILDYCRNQDSVAPALAMYSPGKRLLYCKTFVENQQKAWESEVSKAKRVYIIGLKVHPVDDHIWGVLANSQCKIYYVGGEPEEFLKWAKQKNMKKCCPLAEKFRDALPIIARHLNSNWKPSNT